LLELGEAPGEQSREVAAEVVALALGDVYQRALLGIAEEGDGEAFARQIDVAVKYGLGRAV
jgi:TetR/AcrR family transcriptional regulator, mexJK operon transcriptional repressor